jgi:hypothetical protein
MKRLFNQILRTGSFSIIILLSYSCAAQKNNSSKPYYHEDLNSLRPKTADIVDTSNQTPVHKKGEVVPIYNVNKKVDGVLDSINRYNVSRKVIEGYTIQIYSGQNREEAMNTKRRMASDAYDLTADLEYNQPKFRVKVGGYYSRLDAQKDLLRLKRLFPNAILVPEKIPVR